MLTTMRNTVVSVSIRNLVRLIHHVRSALIISLMIVEIRIVHLYILRKETSNEC